MVMGVQPFEPAVHPNSTPPASDNLPKITLSLTEWQSLHVTEPANTKHYANSTYALGSLDTAMKLEQGTARAGCKLAWLLSLGFAVTLSPSCT